MGWKYDFKPTAAQKQGVEALTRDVISKMREIGTWRGDEESIRKIEKLSANYEADLPKILPKIRDHHDIERIFKELAGETLFESLFWPRGRPVIE